MFHTQSYLLDYPSLPRPHGAPSLLFPSYGDTHCDPRLGGQFGRFAEQNPLALHRRAGGRTEPQNQVVQKWQQGSQHVAVDLASEASPASLLTPQPTEIGSFRFSSFLSHELRRTESGTISVIWIAKPLACPG